MEVPGNLSTWIDYWGRMTFFLVHNVGIKIGDALFITLINHRKVSLDDDIYLLYCVTCYFTLQQ